MEVEEVTAKQTSKDFDKFNCLQYTKLNERLPQSTKMKFCLLCLEENENYVDLSSNEANTKAIGSLLLKYFSFCFTVSVE